MSLQAICANVEMNLSLGYSPYDFISLVDEEDNSANVVFQRPLDFGMQWGFYFGLAIMTYEYTYSLPSLRLTFAAFSFGNIMEFFSLPKRIH